MRNKKWFSVCMMVLCMFLSSVSAFAATEKVDVSYPGWPSYPVSSAEVKITKEDTLVWRIQNTSLTHTLHYSIVSMPPGWLYEPLQLTFGTLEPGAGLTDSKLGRDIVLDYSKDPRLTPPGDGVVANYFYIKLYGPGEGQAELSND